MSDVAMLVTRAAVEISVDQAIRRYRSAERPSGVDVS